MQRRVNILTINHIVRDIFGRISNIITVFIVIGFGASSLSQSSSCFGADWLHFGYDDNYTSYNSAETTIGNNNVSQLQKKWGLGCDDGYFRVISRSPALYRGTLYTTSAGSILQAYDAKTGQELWTFGENHGSGWTPQPVVSEDGVVFYLQPASSMLYDLYAVNASTGMMLWKSPISFDLGFNDTAMLTIDEANNRVYLVAPAFGPDEGALYAIDKETGEIAWYKNKTVGNLSAKGDYVMQKAEKIFGLADVDWFDYQMYSLDVKTQNVDFFFDVPTPLPDADDKAILQYSLCENRMIVGIGVDDDHITDIDKGSVVIYNIDSPTVVRRIDFPYLITGQIACNTETNTLFVPTNPYLYALNATTGQEDWKYMGYGSIYTPSVANGVVYFISDSNMYAVNGITGQKIFSYPLGNSGEESSQVAVDDGMVYFSGNGGSCDLFALGVDSAEPVPRITANGVEGSLALSAIDGLSIAIALDPGSFDNNSADWWAVYYNASSGWHYYDLTIGWTGIGNSLDHLPVSYQGPLFTLEPLEIFETAALTPGTYDFYFGIDLTMNGQLDGSLFYDFVTVDVASAPAASVDVTGTWNGTWNSSVYGATGTFTASIQQQSSTLSGSIDVPEIGLLNQALKGTVDGNAITFGDVGDQITFTGDVSGESSATGTYVYPLLNDSGSWQGTERSVLGACANVAGTWSATESVINNDCGSTETIHQTYVFAQDGCELSLTDDRGGTYTGTIDGDQISLTGSFPDSGGVTTVTSVDLSVSGGSNSLSGTGAWVWSDGDDSCSGSTQVSASRVF